MHRAKQAALLIGTIADWPRAVVDLARTPRETDYRTRRGVRIRCRTRTTDLAEVVVIHSGSEYPPELLGLRDGDSVIDLGVNIGAFATYLHALNGDIDYNGHAIEPNPANHPLLERNLRGTRFGLHQLAIGPFDGQARFQTDGLPLDEAHLDEQGDLVVESSRLETLLERNAISRVALLKIDIEGSEYDLIDRELTTLANHVERILLSGTPSPRARRRPEVVACASLRD